VTTEDLVQLLVDRKVISAAQAQIVRSDQEVTGMSAAEVLMARGWVNEERLKKEAPWLDRAPDAAPDAVASADHGEKKTAKSNEDVYQENLIAYKQLMRKILGEDIYDD
jgi:hypothetical protein